jgi:hypothetical protein
MIKSVYCRHCKQNHDVKDVKLIDQVGIRDGLFVYSFICLFNNKLSTSTLGVPLVEEQDE